MIHAYAPTRTLFTLALAVVLAAPAFAADEPRSGAAPAEVKAAVPAVQELRRAPRTPEELALADVRTATQERVKELVASMEGLQDGPALRALQLKVVEVKREGDLQFLRTKAQFARQRGDLATAQTIEARILAITNPPVRRAPVMVSRPAPGTTPSEGGRP